MNQQDRESKTVAPDGRPDADQPRWRRDFPIDWPEDHYIARRDFTKFMVLTSLAFVVGQFCIAFQNIFRKRRGEPAIRRIADAKQIATGEAVSFAYPEEHNRCLLVRTGENTFVAYSQECTHLSCAVVPEVERGHFKCPCHEGYFDLATGRPLAGPPRRPLKRITLEINGNTIYATGVETRTL